MAALIFGGPVTLTASAVNLTTSLSLNPRIFYKNVLVRADIGNVGTVWFGKNNVTTTTNQLGYLLGGDAFAIDTLTAFLNTDDVYFIGTPGDKIYVTGVS